MLRCLCGLAVWLAAAPACAGGIDFGWGGGCYPENGFHLQTFACNTNTSTFTMTGAFQTTQSMSDFVGVEAVIDLEAGAATLPNWWQFFNTGSCRLSSLSISADFRPRPGRFA